MLSDTTLGLKRSLRRAGRALTGGRRTLRFYYRLDDPYAHLLVQALSVMLPGLDIDVEFTCVPTPSLDVLPQPELWEAWARRDAADLAACIGLHFPQGGVSLGAEHAGLAASALLYERPIMSQLALARKLGDAFWQGDPEGFSAVLEGVDRVQDEAVVPLLESNYDGLRRRGHYHSGMLEYEGEWYWGVDRLRHLRDRLAGEGVVVDDPVPGLSIPKGSGDAVAGEIEYFYSFRSPYSYLSLSQLRGVLDRTGASVRIRPVLPMVMRGLEVPFTKALYIARDCRREAVRLGLPFGHIHDPVGEGVERCLAVFIAAEAQGRGMEFLESAGRASWAEGVNLVPDAGLRMVCERAGVSWADAEASLADDGWRAVVETNRVALFDLGLWGVPSFRYGEFCTWGQDRLFLVESMMNRTIPRTVSGSRSDLDVAASPRLSSRAAECARGSG
jgi:2-hydroxychromene-2-carboxylate isomerase